MKLIVTIPILICGLIAGSVSPSPAHSSVITQEETILTEQENYDNMPSEKTKRSIQDEISKKLQEFSEKLEELPKQFDKVAEAVLKFFKDKGITSKAVEKILAELKATMRTLVDEVKKMFKYKSDGEAESAAEPQPEKIKEQK